MLAVIVYGFVLNYTGYFSMVLSKDLKDLSSENNDRTQAELPYLNEQVIHFFFVSIPNIFPSLMNFSGFELKIILKLCFSLV